MNIGSNKCRPYSAFRHESRYPEKWLAVYRFALHLNNRRRNNKKE